MAKTRPKQKAAIKRLLELTDPVASAKASGLRYVTDRTPGITRRSGTHGFRYFDVAGKPLRDPEVLRRIKALAIPPAWTGVWICPWPNGHVQATGRDARGRKQHRYHPRWREVRDQTKYDRMIAFGQVLPKIRARVEQDLALAGLPRAKVIATVVKLLETTLIRVGNEEYARENNSFGLTTMRSRHVEVNGSKIRFAFRGKSGVKFDLDVKDRRLARIVQRCQDIPGQELFRYRDDDGELRTVTSSDVNDYLREISGEEFTAKDFRTWAGTVLAAAALRELPGFTSKADAKRHVVSAVESVARKLGNTRAVCRKCYIHPAVVNSFLDGTLAGSLGQRVKNELAESSGVLGSDEMAVLGFLEQQLQTENARKSA